MSGWAYINGTVTVQPMGRTQAEKRYILDTVLEHLPLVTGSEGDMDVYVVQKKGHNGHCSCDEFGQVTNNLVDMYGEKSRNHGWLKTQDEYILVVDALLRDRDFKQTYKEFQNWLCRLAKRVTVKDVLVEVKGYEKSVVIKNPNLNKGKVWSTVYGQMFENPSWCSKNKEKEYVEPNWCEYLMWDRAKNTSLPVMLEYKYFIDEENDREVERRLRYGGSDYNK